METPSHFVLTVVVLVVVTVRHWPMTGETFSFMGRLLSKYGADEGRIVDDNGCIILCI